MSTEQNFTQGSQQYQFIQRHLQSVNRSRTPWLIFGGHRFVHVNTPSLILYVRTSKDWKCSRARIFEYICSWSWTVKMLLTKYFLPNIVCTGRAPPPSPCVCVAWMTWQYFLKMKWRELEGNLEGEDVDLRVYVQTVHRNVPSNTVLAPTALHTWLLLAAHTCELQLTHTACGQIRVTICTYFNEKI